MSAFIESDEMLGKAYDHRLVRRLSAFTRPYWGTVAWALLWLTAAQVFYLGLPFLIGKICDLLSGTYHLRDLPLLPAPFKNTVADWPLSREVAGFAGLFTLLTLLYFAANSLHAYLTGILGARIVRDLRDTLFAHMQRLPMSTFDRTPVGRWITRLTNDVEAINNLFTTGIVVAFGDLVLLVGIMGVLFGIEWRLTLACLAMIPLLIAASAVFRMKARRAFREVRMYLAQVNAYLAETVSGTAVTMLFARQGENARRFDRLVDTHYDSCIRSIRVHAVYHPVVTILTGISFAVGLSYGGWMVVQGELALGSLVAFLWYLGHFIHPVQDLADKYNIFQAAMASAERIFRILDTPPEPDPAAPAVAGGGGDAQNDFAVEFHRVTFAYDQENKEPVLQDVSFRVRPGEHVAIVGATGSGKTTLVNLLCRFYDLREGVVRIHGADIAKAPRRYARSRIALVLQEPVIFSGDVYANLRMGESSISEDQARVAAERVRADVFLRALPDGYRTVLPERGSTLSSGQRQLITYARALAFNRPILILDEATANIDPETEALIQEGLQTLMQERTTILIAHRLATLRKVHRILVLDRGRIVEEGTHAQLVARGGIYARMNALQYA